LNPGPFAIVSLLQGEHAEAILNKVKAFIFAVWQGQGMATTG
jgi:hypothetical protein